MPALKSDNKLHADINKYFNVSVYEFSHSYTVATDNGSEIIDHYTYEGIKSANGIAAYIGNEELKIKLFNEVLDSGADRCTKKIRKRLKLIFYSK